MSVLASRRLFVVVSEQFSLTLWPIIVDGLKGSWIFLIFHYIFIVVWKKYLLEIILFNPLPVSVWVLVSYRGQRSVLLLPPPPPAIDPQLTTVPHVFALYFKAELWISRSVIGNRLLYVRCLRMLLWCILTHHQNYYIHVLYNKT